MPKNCGEPTMPPLTDMTDEGADLLRSAIVRAAIDDFKTSINKHNKLTNRLSELKQRYQTYNTVKLVEDVEQRILNNKHTIESHVKFFRSDWYKWLCSIDGEVIIKFFLEQMTV